MIEEFNAEVKRLKKVYNMVPTPGLRTDADVKVEALMSLLPGIIRHEFVETLAENLEEVETKEKELNDKEETKTTEKKGDKNVQTNSRNNSRKANSSKA